MRLEKISIATLPSGEQRLSGFVRYDDGQTEEYWFTAPADLKISNSGNPWLAVLLPFAAYTGQDLELAVPVDPYLLNNAECLLNLWRAWHGKKVKKITIRAEAAPIEERPMKVLSTFTGGVDAYFTVLRHPECKHFVNVLGMDMPLGNREAYDRLLARLVESAKELGARMIPMATNLRETRWKTIPWEDFASGGALCGTFLVLEREFNTILVPSSFDFRTLFPWGTHPLSDPLYSTSRTQIVHEGTSHSRVEKTLAIAHHPTVLKNLHVCFQGHDAHGQDDTNCCTCSKCYRTMTVFEILGKLKECRLFDYRKFHVAKIARLDSTSPVTQSFFNDIRDLALKHGRQDIADNIDRSFKRSRFVGRFDGLQRTPILWRVPHYLRAKAFEGFATLDRP